MALWLLLFYSLLIYNTGFSAGDIVYVETGASVQLDIQRNELPDEFDYIAWKNENSNNVVKYISASKAVKLHASYKNKVEFNPQTFSLTLKNMMKNDSGVYTAIISAENDIEIAKHNVAVIDAVKAPVLVCSSIEPCNFTCTTDNFTISSTVYNSGRCPDEVISSEIHNLSLQCTDDFITCNHSNPVSWRTDIKTIRQFCNITSEGGSVSAQSSLLHWLIPLSCIILGLVVAVAATGLRYNEKNKVAEPNDSTIYAEVEDAATTGKNTTDMPLTIYHTIQQDQKPPKPETDKTIYAMVNKTSAGCESAH